MKKGSEILVKIEKTEFPSTGIGRVDDKLVYAKNCFPGQVVKGRVKRKKADFAEIKPIEVVERAEYEVIAKCPVFGICGGCSSQTLVYEKQLELYAKRWYNRDDIIDAYNREFPGQGKLMRERARRNYYGK